MAQEHLMIQRWECPELKEAMKEPTLKRDRGEDEVNNARGAHNVHKEVRLKKCQLNSDMLVVCREMQAEGNPRTNHHNCLSRVEDCDKDM